MTKVSVATMLVPPWSRRGPRRRARGSRGLSAQVLIQQLITKGVPLALDVFLVEPVLEDPVVPLRPLYGCRHRLGGDGAKRWKTLNGGLKCPWADLNCSGIRRRSSLGSRVCLLRWRWRRVRLDRRVGCGRLAGLCSSWCSGGRLKRGCNLGPLPPPSPPLGRFRGRNRGSCGGLGGRSL